ncbi:MAG: hypothetical protein KAY24_07240 [Candidatus Eisenbacteria sp.]|nr:hypothetical protein [Candidatus Eisenbacteria bacterium]
MLPDVRGAGMGARLAVAAALCAGLIATGMQTRAAQAGTIQPNSLRDNALQANIMQSVATQTETMQLQLEYPESSLGLTESNGFTHLGFEGCELSGRVGAPALPFRSEQIVLPEGMEARGVEVVSISSIRIPCGEIAPAQPPAILGPVGISLPEPEQVPADPAIYEGTDLFPLELARFRGTGHFGDLNIAACEIHPVQYDPASKEIILHTHITLTLEMETDPDWQSAEERPREMARITRQMARAHMHGAEGLPDAWGEGHATPLDPDQYQYVIVTVEEQLAPYETYAAWKRAKGVPATVVTTDWIDGAYAGRDLAEKVRNFIIAATEEWGTSYVLIGGDQHIVPCRVAWAFDCEAGFYPDENDLYTDLYYSDLDGSWDENGNDIFGEVDDNVDLYPDILVGRAPSDDLADANAMINKFLTYERTPPSGHMMDAFFFAEILWSNPYTDSGIGKDMIADRHFSPAYEPIERQYQSLGNESPASVISYLNTGPHLANHGGHASYSLMGCGTGYIDRGDVDGLINGPNYFVLFSIGCWAGAVDYGCIGEHFLENANGGAIAFVGNSRYGWGSPGNPGWGYSETFDSDFYGAILTEGLTQYGAAVAWPKVLRVPYAQDGNVYRWHEYQVNLFGDPEMVCHTADISTMTLDGPTSIPIGSTCFTATVSDPSGPVSGARLCLAGGDVYQVGFSDQTGQVIFEMDLADPQALTLTTTAANHPYAELAIMATGHDPFLTVTSWAIDDDATPPSAGNGDGEIGAGETIELFVTVHNYGGEACSGVTATLSASNPHVSLISDMASYGTVPSGGEATNATPFVFQVQPSCPDDETILFTVLFTDNGSGSWPSTLPLTVVAPGPRVHHYTAVEVIGNGNGIIEPGETVALTVYVRNEGSGNVSPMSASLTTNDANLTVTQGSASTNSSLASGAMAALGPPFEVRVESWCPATTYGALDIAFTHDEGNDVDAFLIAIGEPGFEDDMESGAGGWTHFGTNDQWHLSDYRQHSGTYSWYCGSPSHQYANNTDATLMSPELVAPEAAELSFWCYYDVTIYGVDGLFVDILQDGDWETIDYLGSGGALDSTLFVCDWAEHVYELQDLTPGSTTQVRFRFVTDGSDTAEGFYIDDLAIRSPATSQIGDPRTHVEFALSPAAPNPVVGAARWHLSLPKARCVTARIYDPAGRLVSTLVNSFLEAGSHEFSWDGKAANGRATPGGIYFLHLRAGQSQTVRKLVRLQH